VRILLCPNTHNPAALDAARAVATALTADGHEVMPTGTDATGCGASGTATPVPGSHTADLVIALGGDGTILKAVHLTAGSDVPVLGVNLGRLGFLSGIENGEVVAAVRAAVAGDVVEERRAMLTVAVTPEGEGRTTVEALNEVFVGRGVGARAVDVAVEVDGEPLFRFLCDGVIVATPTGSTAYALSAGGPIVAPDVEAILVVPVAPHTLKARPVVLGPGSRVVVTLPDAERADARVIVDGEDVAMSCGRTRVETTTGLTSVRLLRVRPRGFVADARDTFL
jgi:NAD+ kinase